MGLSAASKKILKKSKGVAKKVGSWVARKQKEGMKKTRKTFKNNYKHGYRP